MGMIGRPPHFDQAYADGKWTAPGHYTREVAGTTVGRGCSESMTDAYANERGDTPKHAWTGLVVAVKMGRNDSRVPRWINRLHVLLRDLHPGGAEVRLDTTDASALLTKIRPVTDADRQRKQIARDVVRDLKRHEASIKELEKQLRAAVTASGTTLTEIQGIGFLTAAKILALTGDIRRFPNQEHYARYAGTAPIDVSSGDQGTHRLSRRGNRQLNAAIHVAAVTQARDPGPGRAATTTDAGSPSTRRPKKRGAA